MTTTLAQWAEEVRSHLDGDRSEEANQLASDYTAGSGTLTVTHGMGGIAAGAILSIGTNTLRVFSVNPVSKTATVSAGWAGSTDANASAGALVRVNPRFTDHRIVKELNTALVALSAPTNGLYRVDTLDLEPTSAVEGYDLGDATGLLRVLEVRREKPGVSLAWPRVPSSGWDVLRSAPSGFASGVALRLVGGPVDGGYGLQVVYAGTFTALTALGDDVLTSGIPATAVDIPPLGAGLALMAGREIARNALNAQGDARRSSEVPPSAIASSPRGLAARYAQRVYEENARLRAQYPLSK